MRHRHALPAVGAALAVLALLAPGVAGAVPNGNGLYVHTADACTGVTGSTDMLLTAGRSIWIGEGHYLVRAYTADGVPGRTLGNMNGLIANGTATCSGTVEGTAIVSTDVLIK